jgi:hypothetical protein
MAHCFTLDKMNHFVDARKSPSPFGAGFQGIGQGELSTERRTGAKPETRAMGYFETMKREGNRVHENGLEPRKGSRCRLP